MFHFIRWNISKTWMTTWIRWRSCVQTHCWHVNFERIKAVNIMHENMWLFQEPDVICFFMQNNDVTEFHYNFHPQYQHWWLSGWTTSDWETLWFGMASFILNSFHIYNYSRFQLSFDQSMTGSRYYLTEQWILQVCHAHLHQSIKHVCFKPLKRYNWILVL